jgi:hypothetical protein
MLEVGRTFITPFDRGDIEELIGSMDDAIDQMQKTAKAIRLFEVESFTPCMQELGKTVVAASQKVGELLPMLRDIKKHAVGIGALAKEIGGDRGALRPALRSGPEGAVPKPMAGTDAMGWIVGSRDSTASSEKVVDRFEDVGQAKSAASCSRHV